jgi:hypothetical protein
MKLVVQENEIRRSCNNITLETYPTSYFGLLPNDKLPNLCSQQYAPPSLFIVKQI